LAATTAAALAGVGLADIEKALHSFQPVEHRLEFVRRINGVDWYNDSKATNVDAAIKAVEAFEGGLWVILGGLDKNSDYGPLVPLLRAKARAALLIGSAAAKIAEHLGGSVETQHVETLGAAVSEAYRRAQAGDTVLLAPACASFDQFSNYAERGRVFKRLVTELPPSESIAEKGESYAENVAL
jgi:UDP-N-acetylmuramoylalanine--D-glutamate ligase